MATASEPEISQTPPAWITQCAMSATIQSLGLSAFKRDFWRDK